MHRGIVVLTLGLLFAAASRAAEPSLHISLPDGCTAKDGVAAAKSLKLKSEGAVDGRTVAFAKLLPDVPYDVEVHLADGTLLRGVNMSWYNEEPLKKDAGDFTDADREEITKLIVEPRAFMKSQPTIFRGDHDRCTVLIHQLRENAFDSGAADEVIWRMELWYYKFERGGWLRVQVQDRNIWRERFSRQQYLDAMKNTKWLPELGGLTISKSETSKTVVVTTLTPPAKLPTTAPAHAPTGERVPFGAE